MADAAAQNGKIPRRIFSYAYTPRCPDHGCPMIPTVHEPKVVYFRCPRVIDAQTGKGCPRRGKAPRVLFEPARNS